MKQATGPLMKNVYSLIISTISLDFSHGSPAKRRTKRIKAREVRKRCARCELYKMTGAIDWLSHSIASCDHARIDRNIFSLYFLPRYILGGDRRFTSTVFTSLLLCFNHLSFLSFSFFLFFFSLSPLPPLPAPPASFN